MLSIAPRLAALLLAVLIATQPALAQEPDRTRDGAAPDAERDLAAKNLPTRSENHLEALGKLELELPGQGFQILSIPGAAEWVNDVEAQIAPGARVAIDLQAADGTWIADAGELTAPSDASGWITTQAWVPATFARAIRLRPVDGRGSFVRGVAAFWNDPELSKDAIESAGEWCEDYPGTVNDLTMPNETVQRASDYLDGHGWTWLFDYGNSNAWEEDFKRNDLGGTNGSYLDATDHMWFCGHGDDDELFIARTDRDDDTVSDSDISGAWGDGDLEWAWMHCCLNLKTTAWQDAMVGVHTIAGFKNVITSSKNWGKLIAKKLIDNGIFDSAWTIEEAWEHSTDTHQSVGDQGRLFAEDSVHYDEFIHGEGPVEADSNDSTEWSTTHTVSKRGKRAAAWDRNAVRPDSEPIPWHVEGSLGKGPKETLDVLVHPEVFQKNLMEQMPIFAAQARPMDQGVAQQFMLALCEALGADCSGLGTQLEDEGGVAAGAGPLSMSGFFRSGGVMFSDRLTSGVPAAPVPDPVGAGAAQQIATQFLNQIGIPLQEPNQFQQILEVREKAIVEYEGTQVLQTIPTGYDVVFAKHLQTGVGEPHPVVGPGGRIHVKVSVDGKIAGFNRVDRQVNPVGMAQVQPLGTILDALTVHGYNVVQLAPEFPADQVIVREASLGYLEHSIDETQDVMAPIYVLDVDLVREASGNKAASVQPGRLYIAADTQPLRSQIVSPPDGSSFAMGAEIPFQAGVQFGLPPYQVEWSTDVQGVISTSPTFSTKTLQAAVKESGQVEPITVSLQVTDANGHVSSAQVSITLLGSTSADDVPTPGFAVEQNSPNPFNPRTTIQFAIPQKADVQLVVYDMRGRRVRTLLDGTLSAGSHSRLWDAKDDDGHTTAAGVYVYRLRARLEDGSVRTEERKMTLVK